MAAFGFQNRPPTGDELKTMQRLLAESLEDGAVGLSSGLIYSPGLYSQTAEPIALAEVMRGSGRPYCSHVRGGTASTPERAPGGCFVHAEGTEHSPG